MPADLDDPETVAHVARAVAPDAVIHAAGRTPPAEPSAFYAVNTLATLHLLDALMAVRKPIRLVLVGSAAELGTVAANELPVAENHPCRPADAYGLSKWLATCAGIAALPPLEVVAARVFNPIGPGQPVNQAFGRFAARLANPELGPMIVGDLHGRRDYVDVRDVARALIALARRGWPGLIYNVGTGRSHRVREGLDHLIERSGRSVEVRVDRGFTVSPGARDSRADIARIVAHTLWRPEIRWEQSLDDLWDEALARSRLPLTT
jgi:GDP-4-dehydro-6-deoxy-D-mannose reductase